MHAHHQQPNPFGPHCQTFSRLGSLDGPSGPSRGEESAPPDAETTPPMPTQVSPTSEENPISITTPSILGPVDSHTLTVAWDDESHVDTPYDNPFYTKAISDVLWLPRDPFGILDLDDTINLRVSLTSELSAGQLGVWQGPLSSPLPLSSPDSPALARVAAKHRRVR